MTLVSRDLKIGAAKTAAGLAAAVALVALLGLAIARQNPGAIVAVSIALLGLLITLGTGIANRIHRS